MYLAPFFNCRSDCVTPARTLRFEVIKLTVRLSIINAISLSLCDSGRFFFPPRPYIEFMQAIQ